MVLSNKSQGDRLAEYARREDRDRILGLIEGGGYLSLDTTDFYKALKHGCKYAGPPDGLVEALEEKWGKGELGSRELFVVLLFPKDSSLPWLGLQKRLIGLMVAKPFLASSVLGEAEQAKVCGKASYTLSRIENENGLVYQATARVDMDGQTYESSKFTSGTKKAAEQLAALHLLQMMVLPESELFDLPNSVDLPEIERIDETSFRTLKNWCRNHNTKMPEVVCTSDGSGWEAKIRVVYGGKCLQSLSCKAKGEVNAINLAAADILNCLLATLP